ncbi:hypothetical protein FACS189487_04140 [Campylobacterota bacterium]|nr:hypothetical protein FACS189487_04140 [Campylobacterota bacterium]
MRLSFATERERERERENFNLKLRLTFSHTFFTNFLNAFLLQFSHCRGAISRHCGLDLQSRPIGYALNARLRVVARNDGNDRSDNNDRNNSDRYTRAFFQLCPNPTTQGGEA